MTENTTTPDDESLEDFDAFWTAQDRKCPSVKIMGKDYTLPAALPLQFELEARRLQRSKSDKDVHKLVGILFGADSYSEWVAAGMDIEQFQLLLAWGPRRIAGQKGADGKPITLAEVKAELDAKDDEPDPT